MQSCGVIRLALGGRNAVSNLGDVVEVASCRENYIKHSTQIVRSPPPPTNDAPLFSYVPLTASWQKPTAALQLISSKISMQLSCMAFSQRVSCRRCQFECAAGQPS